MPFGLGVGTAVSGFQEKEAWHSTEGNCSKFWWWLWAHTKLLLILTGQCGRTTEDRQWL